MRYHCRAASVDLPLTRACDYDYLGAHGKIACAKNMHIHAVEKGNASPRVWPQDPHPVGAFYALL